VNFTNKILRCDSCSVGIPMIWSCLSDACHFQGCGRNQNKHCLLHYEKTLEENNAHPLYINFHTKCIWCFGCDKEIIEEDITEDHAVVVSFIRDLLGPPKPKTALIERNAKSSTSTKGLCGLKNLGNTCYMNAALQALSNCPPFRNYIIQQVSESESKSRPSESTTTSGSGLKSGSIPKYGIRGVRPRVNLAINLKRVFEAMWEGKYTLVSPEIILSEVCSIYYNFRGYAQQDSQEFLRCLLDRVHEELKHEIPSEVSKSSNEASKTSSDVPSNADVAPSPTDVSKLDDGPIPNSQDQQTNGEISKSDPEATTPTPEVSTTTSEVSKANCEVPNTAEISTSIANVLISTPDVPTTNNEVPKIIAEISKPNGKVSKKANGASPNNKTSVVSEVFEGVLMSRVKCLNCKKVSPTKDKFLDLSVSIPSRKSVSWFSNVVYVTDMIGLTTHAVALEDCLAAFCQTEVLTGADKFKCEFCKSANESEKTLSLVKSPEILCIHIKRFRFESYFSKMNNFVAFQLKNLDLGPYFDKESGPIPSEDRVYDLIAVICHSGSFEGGHYVSYCLNSETKKWYEFDDSAVREVSEQNVQDVQAYVLFYQKQKMQT